MRKSALHRLTAGSLLVAASALLVAGCGSSDDKSSGEASKSPKRGSVQLLYAAEGKSGTLIPAGEKDRYKLTMKGVGNQVVAFADRPRRDTFNISADDFF